MTMQPPMLGTWTIKVKSTKPYTIHGDLYYEVQAVKTDDPTETSITLRIPQHAILAAPMPSQKLTVTFLMGQVTSAQSV